MGLEAHLCPIQSGNKEKQSIILESDSKTTPQITDPNLSCS